MSYQPRLDQLEAEVFETRSTSTISLTHHALLPYLIILVVSFLSLYSFCPRALQIKKNRTYVLHTQRFAIAWLGIAIALCLVYYTFLKKSEIKTA